MSSSDGTSVGDAYDAMAEQYAALFLHELDEDVQSQRWLREFADIAREQGPRGRPGLPLLVSDLTNLGHADSTLGGIVARHSVIHLDPAELATVFAEWRRALAPGAPLFLSFFGSRTADAHGEPFDHKVTTAYELFPAIIGTELDHTTILARLSL